MKVYIEGKLKTRSWTDDNNQTRYTTEVVADQMTMLSGNPERPENQQKSNYPNSVENKPVQPTDQDLSSSDDDDLPF